MRITTPRSTSTLTWNAGFGAKWTAKFEQAQRIVDSECLRLMNPYTPMRTGNMINSATRGTVIGSGLIEYTAPYARRQYYTNRGGSPLHPSAHAKWFEEMKADHLAEIKRKVGQIL